jgi:GAF domain-containing protein
VTTHSDLNDPEDFDPELLSFAELVAELAMSFLDDDGPGDRNVLVEHIVGGAVAVIPGVTSAAVETIGPDGLLAAPVMVGDDVARSLMDAQNATGQGPGLDAWRDNKQIYVADLAADDRWPQFSRRLDDSTTQSMVCTPMEINRQRLGVLSLSGTGLHFDDPDLDIETLARVFAAHAGVALSGEKKVADIQRALDGRDVIGQAKGILMERFKVTPEVAFAMLVRASANTNTKLRRVCDILCATGVLLPDPPRRVRTGKDRAIGGESPAGR